MRQRPPWRVEQRTEVRHAIVGGKAEPAERSIDRDQDRGAPITDLAVLLD